MKNIQSAYTKSASISATDLLIIIWLVYCLLRSIGDAYVVARVYPYLFIFVCYVSARLFHTRILFAGIISIGIWQSVFAITQNIGWIVSNNSLYSTTGSFNNPGLLGGFLAVSIICLLCVGLHLSKKYLIGFTLLLGIQGYALMLSDSRAAWLAVICGGLFLIWNQSASFRAKISSSLLLRLSSYILLIVVLCGLYFYKPHSANGRLLIWRVTTVMIVDKPIFGHGINGFNQKYMHYQAAYFAKHKDSPFLQYADNISYPYNEFLHIWVDQGVIGLILLFGLLTHTLCTPIVKNNYKGALIAYLVFAQLSYPSRAPELLALFPILLASIHNQSQSVYTLKSIHWGIIVAALCCIGYVGKEYVFRKQCRTQIQKLILSTESRIDDNTFINNNYQHFLEYPRIADIYAQYVFMNYDPQKALTILTDVGKVIPTSELYCDLGDLYSKIGDLGKARMHYTIASNMVPKRLTPKYKLFVLFKNKGDTLSAYQQGCEILSMQILIEGTRTLKMKAEIQQYMKQTINLTPLK